MSASADLGGGQVVTTSTTDESTIVPGSDWTSGFTEDVRNYVTTKGFKDAASVVESYRNLEKLRGVPQERLLTLPEKEDAPEWANIYQRLGTPKEKTEYKFELPDEAKNDEFENWARDTFHKHNLTKAQAENVMREYGEYLKNGLTKTATEYQQKVSTEMNELKAEWGQAHDKYMGLAKRAVSSLGIEAEQIDALEQALGYKGVMSLFKNLGSKLGEDSFVSGDNKANNKFGALSPSEAKSRIDDLMKDKAFVDKYLSKDVSSVQEMERLHRIMSGV